MDAFGFDPNRREVDRTGEVVVRCALCKERIRDNAEAAVVNGELRHATVEGCVAQLHKKIDHLKEANSKYGRRQDQRGRYIQELSRKLQNRGQQVHLLKQLVYLNQTALHDAGLRAIYARDSNTFVSESHHDSESLPVDLPVMHKAD